MGQKEKELLANDPFYSEWKDSKFRGNLNTTIIKTALGKTIMVQHDVSSTQPYSRIHLVKGTKGMAANILLEHIALGRKLGQMNRAMKELYGKVYS